MSNNELTPGEKASQTFLESQSNENTIKSRAAGWIKNAIANRKHYRQGNPPLAGLTVFVVAAGPSLKKNVAELRRVSARGVVLCVEAAFRFLMEQGITPEYCMSIDGDARMLSMIEGADTSRTTLIAMASASPALIEAWKGPKFFVRCLGGRVDIDDQLVAVAREVVAARDIKAGETLHPLDDIRVDFAGLTDRVVTGGNVTGAAHSFAVDHLRASRVVFVGADYAWEKDGEFYAGGAHTKMADERVASEKDFTHPVLVAEGTPAADIATNFSMFQFKRWHEDYAGVTGVPVVNATEGGILGVNREGRAAHGWEHLTLAAAVAKFCPKDAPPLHRTLRVGDVEVREDAPRPAVAA